MIMIPIFGSTESEPSIFRCVVTAERSNILDGAPFFVSERVFGWSSREKHNLQGMIMLDKWNNRMNIFVLQSLPLPLFCGKKRMIVWLDAVKVEYKRSRETDREQNQISYRVFSDSRLPGKKV